jgi:hypothetical protein
MQTRQTKPLCSHALVPIILMCLFALCVFQTVIAQPNSTSRPSSDTEHGKSQTIRATCFELVNANGEVTARLWNGESGAEPHLVFYGDAQILRVRIEELKKNAERQAKPRNRIQPPLQRTKPIIRTIDIAEHSISEVLGSGKYVRLDDGTTWEVDRGEESTVDSWGSLEIVLKTIEVNGVLLYEIINTDDDESVGVRPVR